MNGDRKIFGRRTAVASVNRPPTLTHSPYSRAVRRRETVIAVAAAAFVLALVLAALRVGETPGRLSDWQALVLGITQGATELLPVSSSGHLILVPWAFGWHYLQDNPDFNKTFDVALHLGTLIAVVIYFWRDLGRLIRAFVQSVGQRRRIETADERIAWYVVDRDGPGRASPAPRGRASSRRSSATRGR